MLGGSGGGSSTAIWPHPVCPIRWGFGEVAGLRGDGVLGALVGDAGQQVGLGCEVGGPVGGVWRVARCSVRVRAQASRSAIWAMVTGWSFMLASLGRNGPMCVCVWWWLAGKARCRRGHPPRRRRADRAERRVDRAAPLHCLELLTKARLTLIDGQRIGGNPTRHCGDRRVTS